jgi:hypothetical protein
MENIMYTRKPRQNNWIYTLCLVLSFVWLSLYSTSISFIDEFTYGFGNILAESNMSVMVISVLTESLASWI